jgi:DNA repair ATPase RecN
MMTGKNLKNEIDSRAEQMFSLNGAAQVSNAKQASALMETFRREAEDKITVRRGAEAQIDSNKILADQHRELAVMKEIIDSLLKYTVEQGQQQALQLQEQNKIEDRRYIENTRLARVATWTGIFSMFIAVVALVLQIASQWDFIRKWF